MRNLFSALTALSAATAAAAPVAAQVPARDSALRSAQSPALPLDEAVAIARRNNPAFLQTSNDRRVARARLLSARSAFLPSVDASFGTQYQEGRAALVNGVPLGAASDVISSSYSISARAAYSVSTFIEPKLARASAEAVDADITTSAELLRAGVVQQYITVLQQQARAALQDTLLTNTRTQLELARAREAVGAGTSLDTKRAQVAVGQQEVAAIQAHNLVEVEKLRLFQQLGVAQPADVRLTTSFEVSEPGVTLQQLLDMARSANPTLESLRSRERVAQLGYRSARGEYTPTLSFYTQWGGYTQQFTNSNFLVEQAQQQNVAGRTACIEQAVFVDSIRSLVPGFPGPTVGSCNTQFAPLTNADISRIRSSNRFDFQRQPWQLQAGLSFPIFNGFQREGRIQIASAQRADAQYLVRAQELALTQGVTAAYLTMTTAVRTAQINEQNAATAREALSLAQERYRVGAANFVDVAQARADFERAETDRINAVYDYHKAFAALESAVGRPLR
ncbi:MAG TPA: TolC family protein [Gemmatimonadaceae bacterium]|nr:TolC family protein [Gemmatimonadaceae bacterium]